MVLPQQQARNPPSIREASEDKQIHRFLHRSNEKVRNLTRFTCNPMESDAEKEEIERGYRNYLPLHHQIREIDATNKKTERGRGLGSARNQREPDKGEDRLRIDVAGRRRQASCPRRRGSKVLNAPGPIPSTAALHLQGCTATGKRHRLDHTQ